MRKYFIGAAIGALAVFAAFVAEGYRAQHSAPFTTEG